MAEIIGSLVCVLYSVSFLLLLLLLKPKVLSTNSGIFKFSACAISTNFIIVILPLVLIRWFFSKSLTFKNVAIFVVLYSGIIFIISCSPYVALGRVDLMSISNLMPLVAIRQFIIIGLLLITYQVNFQKMICIDNFDKVSRLISLDCGSRYYSEHKVCELTEIYNVDLGHALKSIVC
jgi:hypothetical protein